MNDADSASQALTASKKSGLATWLIVGGVLAMGAVVALTSQRTRRDEQAAAQEATASGQHPADQGDEHWRARLTPEQFAVTRRKATERAFTGKYWDHREPGSYQCVCCGAKLFDSDTKYDSECGWPSFFAPADAANIQTEADYSLGIGRTEVLCKQCGAHLGHVFDDGPRPTGQRYCINSAALDFTPPKSNSQTSEAAKE